MMRRSEPEATNRQRRSGEEDEGHLQHDSAGHRDAPACLGIEEDACSQTLALVILALMAEDTVLAPALERQAAPAALHVLRHAEVHRAIVPLIDAHGSDQALRGQNRVPPGEPRGAAGCYREEAG